MKLVITEAVEARILQLTEVAAKTLEVHGDLLLGDLIEEIETDLAEADRIEGDYYECG